MIFTEIQTRLEIDEFLLAFLFIEAKNELYNFAFMYPRTGAAHQHTGACVARAENAVARRAGLSIRLWINHREILGDCAALWVNYV